MVNRAIGDKKRGIHPSLNLYKRLLEVFGVPDGGTSGDKKDKHGASVANVGAKRQRRPDSSAVSIDIERSNSTISCVVYPRDLSWNIKDLDKE